MEKFISMEFVASLKLLPSLYLFQLVLVCQLFWGPVDSFWYPKVSVMVSCSRMLEICKNITGSSSTVNLRLSRSAFKLTTQLEHTHTIHSCITICSFCLIINLNRSFSLPNEIPDDGAYFALGGRLDWLFSWNLFCIDSSQCTDLEPIS